MAAQKAEVQKRRLIASLVEDDISQECVMRGLQLRVSVFKLNAWEALEIAMKFASLLLN